MNDKGGRIGFAGAITVDRVLRELDNPKSPFSQLKETQKIMLRGLAEGLTTKEIARTVDIQPRHATRLLKEVTADCRRILREHDLSEVLSSKQDNVISVDASAGFCIGSIQACAAPEEPIFEPMLSAKEAAKLLDIHEKTLQGLARSGEVPCLRFGKYWRFRASVLDGWVRERLISDHQSRRAS